ncbi:MAG: LytR C-terminal domain-containing protein [Propionibacteriaceae bacterium]
MLTAEAAELPPKRSTDSENISPSKYQTFVAWFSKTRVALITLIVVLLAMLLWGFFYSVLPPAPRATPKTCPSPTPNTITSSAISVTVLNGGARAGTGGQVSTQLSNAGFQIKNVANTNERVTDTVIRGSAVDSPQARLVAAFFNTTNISSDNRADPNSVDVVIGSQFQPMNPSAAQSTTIISPSSCDQTAPTTPSASHS